MNNNKNGNGEIYPGSYVPSHTENDICAQDSSGFSGETDCAVSTKELNQYYEIVVAIPTAKKENLAIYVEDHDVTITACRENLAVNESTVGSKDDLDIFFKKTIKLPEHADADFIHAVYIKGVLHMFIAKSKRICEVQHHAVAVY